jgi:hypothetical protein
MAHLEEEELQFLCRTGNRRAIDVWKKKKIPLLRC